MGTRRTIMLIAAAALVAASCSGASTGQDGRVSAAEVTAGTSRDIDSAMASLSERLGAIDEAIAVWRASATIEDANAAAEKAANLVVGPNGPGYGDRDDDGVIGGENAAGLLAGSDGTPAGIATPLESNACVNADVLGGSWADPGARWDEMLEAIDQWRPDNNTMPSLASHPMRIVGWSTFTLKSGSLDLAHEYAGHAKLHIDISLRALDC